MIKKIEQYVNHQLNKIPKVKKLIKRVYQRIMYSINPKEKIIGNVSRVTPIDDYEYFYGYYDTTPWDQTDRYMLSLRVKNTTNSPAPSEPAEIILIDTQNNNELKLISKTRTWNIQQGAMLQWLGPDFKSRIIYNDFRDGKYCSIIKNVWTGDEKVIDFPIYTVSTDGKFALTLDFSRLHRLRPGYGYSNIEDATQNEAIPNSTCLWRVDLINNKAQEIIGYNDLYRFEHREEMENGVHKVNHIMLSPNNNRFMFIHRWIVNGRTYSRLLTANVDGSDLFNLSDDDMVSHCSWKTDSEIIGYLRKKSLGNGYFILQDQSKTYSQTLKGLIQDGHPTFSKNDNHIVTDSYPDRKRMCHLFIFDQERVAKKASFFAPFKYDNEFRCDLHPRWNNQGNLICVDSVCEGKRAMYIVNLEENKNEG